MSTLSGNMSEHLEQIIQKINKGEHFGLIRPGDGEYLIMENHTFTAQSGDDWTNDSCCSILKEQLINTFKIINPDLYIGLPCNTCCNVNMYDKYINKYQVQKSQLTYANVFCNSNWKIFTDFLKSYDKGFYLITAGTKECKFPIKDRYYVDKFLVNNWDKVWKDETNRILEYVKDKTDVVICFAAGPITKIWIPMCMELNPTNVYLDIGSALDYYTKGAQNARPYTDSNNYYSKGRCSFKR
jgi:hypothetical protein